MTPSNTQLSALKTALFAACLLPALLLWRGFEFDTLGANMRTLIREIRDTGSRLADFSSKVSS